MEIELNETQKLIQQTARDYARRVILPQAAELDHKEQFPREILRGLGELGLLAVNVPEELGGAAAGVVSYALAMQEVAYACASTAVTMAVTNMVGEVIATFGTEEQRKRCCPKLASAEWIAGAFALSEPGAGSDAGAMTTTAHREGDSWILDGDKQWITSGAHAGVFVVWARTGDKEALPGTRGISCFLVEGGTPGLSIGKAEDKLGLRASNTVSLHFERCRVPGSALLGELHGGFKIAMMALDGGRIGISSQAIGIARAALDESVQYAKDRRAFEHRIGDFQAIKWKLADMKTELDAASMLSMRAASLKEKGRSFSREASMAKLFASEAANRICNEAVQIHGGYGYV
ncbi:MAG TPA: acyl-CoA dehydrogenase family protein, partial [Polyangiaceae bacterium]|nr:acyl-CoA dehydrogenase family protein [Polyangiaceae bacterium]